MFCFAQGSTVIGDFYIAQGATLIGDVFMLLRAVL